MTCPIQTPKKTIAELAGTPKSGVITDEADAYPYYDTPKRKPSNIAEIALPSPASSKRSFDGEDQIPNKRRKEKTSEDSLVDTSGQAGRADPVATGTIAETKNKSRTASFSESITAYEECNCDDPVFYYNYGHSTHGLWPYGALVCECGRRITSSRTSGEPPIGRGNGGRL